MQKTATDIFMTASAAFGVLGILLILFTSANNNGIVNEILVKGMLAMVCVILPSFAISLAGKYLQK